MKDRKPQVLSKARLDALLDIRLMYRTACLYSIISDHLPGYHKWNSDATTVIVEKDRFKALSPEE